MGDQRLEAHFGDEGVPGAVAPGFSGGESPVPLRSQHPRRVRVHDIACGSMTEAESMTDGMEQKHPVGAVASPAVKDNASGRGAVLNLSGDAGRIEDAELLGVTAVE